MRISSINSQSDLSKNKLQKSENKNYTANNSARIQNPAFKSIGMTSVLGMSAALMQWIESKGYLVSFLIQDGLGMTLPRTLTGFKRDKEITGEYNMQEGFEVLGREGLTGPYIMFVAPAVLAITGKFCKSTNTNTRLIKRMAENMKTMISRPEFDNSIKKDAQKFKNEFYNYNISKIYKDTVPNDAKAGETIKYLQDEFAKYNSKDKKESKAAYQNIITKINDKMVETSTNLYGVNKLVVGDDKTKASFAAGEVLRAVKDFGDDAITNNPEFAAINNTAVENMKNNFAAKRWFTNIANIVVTLGGLSVLPKIYAPSDVAPGAKAMTHMQKKGEDSSEISFKGRGVNNGGFFASLGKLITKYIPEKMQELLEYTGYNFSKTTFALLATLGLLFPRGKRAWERAQIDENGKRDMSEINEILLRDTVSSLSVVFAVPMLTKGLVRSYEDNKGFILTNRASDGKNIFKKIADILNPYSNLEVLSVADLDAIYGNIDSKAKLMNFSNFVENKGGDLEKILSKSEHKSVMFNENTFTLESIKHLSKEEKNKKIIELFKKIDEKDPHVKEGITKLMKGSGNIKQNKIAKMARGLNSLPGAISTVFISPVLLGILIPMLTYHNTRKANEKKVNTKLA